MTRVLKFEVSGWANIDLDDVTFFDHTGASVDVSALSLEEIQEKLRESEIDFDWLSLAANGGFNVGIEDVRVEEEE